MVAKAVEKIVSEVASNTSVLDSKKAKGAKQGNVVDIVTEQPDLFDTQEREPREARSYGTVPQVVDFDHRWKPVRKYQGVREQRPDGLYANLVCPNGALHCIRIEPGDAVIIVRKQGEFVDMVVKGATDKATALQAAAKKFIRLIERNK